MTTNCNREVIRQAEMAVIGAVILQEASLSRVIDKVNTEDFYHSELKEIYKCILKISSLGKPIDFITVLGELSKDNFFMQDELKELLLLCAETTPSLQNIEHYADIVHKSALSRKMEESLLTYLAEGFTGENIIEKGENLINEMSKIISPIQNKKMRHLNEISSNLLDYYTGKTLDNENRCDTGYGKIDKILKGMSGGNLIILASRPKVGKTAFALSIAQNVSETGKKVVFFSQEMLGEELCERILSKKSGIFMDKLINKSLLSDELKVLEKTMQNMKNSSIIVSDAAGISAQNIRLNCRMIKNLGLIIVDYLQLMTSTDSKTKNRNQEIGAISRELKKLATDLNVPILCLSQLNRNSNDTQKPTPSELRDSGSIEQDANKVILMWCVKKHQNEGKKTIGVDVALNRRGSTGITLLNFNGETMQFTELEERYQESERFESDWRNKIYKKSF